MNILAKDIPYKSIIMRCDAINSDAYSEVPECFSIVKYNSQMKAVWCEIQKSAGQFVGYIDDDIVAYFEKKFVYEKSEIEERCFFLRDNIDGTYVGTCCAWFSEKEGKLVPVLHWLAVVPSYRNKGCARILITHILKYFEQNCEQQVIYLHTQPASYKAIKLYNDFGFNITMRDSYGDAINEYEGAMEILKEVMRIDVYKNICSSVIQ
ncbi:MAG: GNAT family N-acetyltransferase [Butyribacter sp.]|nr:GNAT family N-acetyltransferase [Butyribacter sp.]